MGLKYRQMISEAGPDTSGCWQPFASASVVPLTLMTDALNYPLTVIPQVSKYSTIAAAPTDFLSSSGYIQSLSGIYIVSDTNISASLASDVFFSVYRAGTQLGSARIAGWASGAAPAITALVPVAVPFYVTNTTALTGAPNGTLSTTQAICRLKPLDVVTVEFGDVDASGLSGVNIKAYLDIQ